MTKRHTFAQWRNVIWLEMFSWFRVRVFLPWEGHQSDGQTLEPASNNALFQIYFLSQPRPTTLTYTSLTLYIGLTLLWMFALTPFWRRKFSFSGPSHLDSAAQCKAVLWSWIRIKQNSNQIETDLITEGSLHLVRAEHQLVGGNTE